MVQNDNISLSELAPGASLMPNWVWWGGAGGVDVARRGVAIAGAPIIHNQVFLHMSHVLHQLQNPSVLVYEIPR